MATGVGQRPASSLGGIRRRTLAMQAMRHGATIDLFNVSLRDGKVHMSGELSETTCVLCDTSPITVAGDEPSSE